ncbi:Uncharacterised protein [Candidatus Bilamarchaeum dharawalense]|uniref:PsbP C-terminal domain-containing protein n=1 Tax=Candidatus Bilamarchaeum dharawalense TaxID=2885759 RepID=A0A5E4LPY9_9ARCH|nr:Uncharacterised protein [Candidatus Bilamarchaeum dharawalense]
MVDVDYKMAGLTMKYPSDWKVESMSPDAAAFLPPGKEITDLFGEKFMIMNSDVKQFSKMPGLKDKPLTLENIADESIKAMKQQGYQGGVQKNESVKIGGLAAKKMTIEAEMEGTKLKINQYIVLNAEKVYLITYSAKSDEYETFLSAIEKMISSIQF